MDKTIATPAANRNRFPLLQACEVRRRSGDRLLLDGVSLGVGSGDRVAIVGPTGSGKTLLLRSLAMLDPLEGGRIIWHGAEVRRHDVPGFRSRVIYLQQRPALVEGTVEQNLKQPFSFRVHSQRKFDLEVHRAWLESLNRDESFLRKQHRELSGGESQIVALLRALQLEPEVLLLDEPTSALDSHSSRAVERLLDVWLARQTARRATVWVTHDHQQAERVASRTIEMSAGRLQARRMK